MPLVEEAMLEGAFGALIQAIYLAKERTTFFKSTFQSVAPIMEQVIKSEQAQNDVFFKLIQQFEKAKIHVEMYSDIRKRKLLMKRKVKKLIHKLMDASLLRFLTHDFQTTFEAKPQALLSLPVKTMSDHHLIVSEADISNQKPPKPRRVASLDIFRGLTVALMILVDDAGGEWPMIGHAPWNGCNLADFVMPFFLFIVGMAIPLAFKRIISRSQAVKKVIFRTVKLLLWGLLLQGGYSHAPDKLTYGVDMKEIRLCGILQRIAFAYLIMALVEIFTKDDNPKDLQPGPLSIFRLYCWHWLVGACFLATYLAVIYGTYVPDWQFTVYNRDSADYMKVFNVLCNDRGKLDPPCNAVGYVDRKILGLSHMYHRPAWRRSKDCTGNSPYEGPFKSNAPSWCHAPFEPEGLISSVSAVLSTVIGVHFGHVLVHFQDHLSRLKHWILMGIPLLILGFILHFTNAVPLNKQLYSLSYVCVTSGAAALVFSAIYVTVDIWGLRWLFLPFEWIGMNAMLVYVMAAAGIFAGFVNGWYYDDPHNTLIYWIKKHIFIGVWHSERVGILLYVIFGEILFWGIVSGILHRQGLYWKL